MNPLKAARKLFKTDRPQTVDPLNGYNRWAAKYATESNPVLALEERTLQELLPDLSGKRVLDVGCGAGRVTRIAAKHKARQVTGVDFSPNMLAEAVRYLTGLPHLHLVRSDARQLPFNNASFDFITCSLMISHVEDMPLVISELSRVTKAGGQILISEFHPFGHLLGWQRSFVERRNGQSQELQIRYFRYLHADYFQAFKAAKLEILTMREMCIDESVKHFYQTNPKHLEIFNKYTGFPLVLCFSLKRR